MNIYIIKVFKGFLKAFKSPFHKKSIEILLIIGEI